MEVKDFVKQVLKDVTEAIQESDSDVANFYLSENINNGIEFDLAVVSKKEGAGKVGLEVWGIGAKTKGSISNEIVNRIKFKVHPSLKDR